MNLSCIFSSWDFSSFGDVSAGEVPDGAERAGGERVVVGVGSTWRVGEEGGVVTHQFGSEGAGVIVIADRG